MQIVAERTRWSQDQAGRVVPAAPPKREHPVETRAGGTPPHRLADIGVGPRVAGMPMQLKRVNVNFDSYAAAGPGDVLATSGLANCIAVVAQDQTTKNAVMVHFDTGAAVNHSPEQGRGRNLPEKRASWRSAWLVSLTNLRQLLLAHLKPQGSVKYHVGLGAIWQNLADVDDTKVGFWWMRYELIMCCIGIFGVEPTEASGTMEFSVDYENRVGAALAYDKLAAPAKK